MLDGRNSVFLTGTFDIANYGDLLIPLVASKRLGDHEFHVVPVSPTERRPDYTDAMAPVSVDKMACDSTFDARGIVVGGGYILMTQSAAELSHYAQAGVAQTAYPSLWIGATLAAAIRDIPIVLNAPGVPFPFSSRRHKEIIHPALTACDYRSVRDRQSARLLDPHDAELAIVPDTVLDLPRVWPRDDLMAVHAERRMQFGIAPSKRTLALHVRARAMGDPAELAAMVDQFARRHDLFPMLLVLGRELGDIRVARRISTELSVPHGVVDAGSLQELAAQIAGAAVYIGGSFHGYVTAAAYGTPAVVVAVPSHGKFAGLLSQLERPDDLARNWKAAFDRATGHLASGVTPSLPSWVGSALDQHWDSVTMALRLPDRGRAGRMHFLRRYLRHGAIQRSSSWLLTPHLGGLRSTG